VRIKKPPQTGGLKRAKNANTLLAESNIACDCQKQKPSLIKRKRKPDFVVKLLHLPSQKPELCQQQAELLLQDYYNRKGCGKARKIAFYKL
jgi:hypothetical protein